MTMVIILEFCLYILIFTDKIPQACHKTFKNDMKGVIEKGEKFEGIDPECVSGSADQPLDVLWTIITEEENKVRQIENKFELL